MFKHYFEQVNNVAIWPIISLSIFFIFFIGLIIYVMKIKKDHVHYMQDLPLSDDDSEPLSIHDKLKNL